MNSSLDYRENLRPVKTAINGLHLPPSGGVIWGVSKDTTTQPQLNKLAAFRQSLHRCLTKTRDALFELIDAILTTPQLTSFPELSCAPVFRRQWPSLYEAVQDGYVDRKELLKLEVENLPSASRPLLVGDLRAWSRPQARTLRDRSFEHQPTPIRRQKPITIGHGYSTLGVVPEKEGSWFLPLLHERINSDTTPSVLMAEQLKEVCPLLSHRPLCLFDSEYGSGAFLKLTDGIECDLLFRLRPNRKLYLGARAIQGARPLPFARGNLSTLRPFDLA